MEFRINGDHIDFGVVIGQKLVSAKILPTGQWQLVFEDQPKPKTDAELAIQMMNGIWKKPVADEPLKPMSDKIRKWIIAQALADYESDIFGTIDCRRLERVMNFVIEKAIEEGEADAKQVEEFRRIMYTKTSKWLNQYMNPDPDPDYDHAEFLAKEISPYYQDADSLIGYLWNERSWSDVLKELEME